MMGNKKRNALITAAVGGDNFAVEELCRQNEQGVLYLCIKLMGNVADGEDAAQECLMILHNKIATLQSPQAFSSWLYRIVANQCNLMKREKAKKKLVLLEDDDSLMVEVSTENLPHEEVEREELQTLIRQAINSLPEDCKLCIVLFYYENLKYEEIGKVLGVTATDVGNLLVKGKKLIRRYIEEAEEKENRKFGAFLPLLKPALAQDAEQLTKGRLRLAKPENKKKKPPFIFKWHFANKMVAVLLSAVAGTIFLTSGNHNLSLRGLPNAGGAPAGAATNSGTGGKGVVAGGPAQSTANATPQSNAGTASSTAAAPASTVNAGTTPATSTSGTGPKQVQNQTPQSVGAQPEKDCQLQLGWYAKGTVQNAGVTVSSGNVPAGGMVQVVFYDDLQQVKQQVEVAANAQASIQNQHSAQQAIAYIKNAEGVTLLSKSVDLKISAQQATLTLTVTGPGTMQITATGFSPRLNLLVLYANGQEFAQITFEEGGEYSGTATVPQQAVITAKLFAAEDYPSGFCVPSNPIQT
ncbi:RNA polymerase sigma factor [Ruminococcaceae bacterium OttesenSCG-928-A16]|nr:RNA polymerase sigma factor [Ruminococcaceae bacterium OttesenSCG-928-A16]